MSETARAGEDPGSVRVRHATTDPTCSWHEPPRNWWQRRRFDRARGRACVICRPDEWARLVDYWTTNPTPPASTEEADHS